jgi:DNA transformation protein
MSKRKPASRTGMKSLASSGGFETFVIDQLSGLGEVLPRKMFGGVGLYCDGLFFALIARDELYLKVDDQTRPFFEAAGSTAFRPYDDRPATMQYYSVPLAVLESAPELVGWARRALGAASRAADHAGTPGTGTRIRPEKTSQATPESG